MTELVPRPRDECAFDAVALGEVMLRFDPGEGRVHTARSFDVYEGGGEYNVVRGLRRCFGLRAAVVTALADNAIGRLIEGLILEGGVNTDLLQWAPYDGIGRSVRNGLTFTERGFGVRGAVSTVDRGHTAISQVGPGIVDWDALFGEAGVRWFHTGGIYAGLSGESALVAVEAVKAARRHGTIVSYDLNYRRSLWQDSGGQARAQQVNQQLAPYVDVLIGNEEDFTAGLGFDVPGVNPDLTELPIDGFRRMINTVAEAYPNLAVLATTLRTVHTATRNDWGAIAYSADGGFVEATPRQGLEILDRVGGGDSFASGLIFALLDGRSLAAAVEIGAAHGALAMTTPGDTSMATLDEVEALAAGAGARIQR